MTFTEGPIVWLTGLPAAGKTTVARSLWNVLRADGAPAVILDSDALRKILTPFADFSEEERDRFYDALGDLALMIAEGGTTVIISATATKRRWRDRVRARAEHFVEVLLFCDGEIREARDPKGLYAKARAGLIDKLPGVQVEYEDPMRPELVFDTGRARSTAVAQDIARMIDQRNAMSSINPSEKGKASSTSSMKT